MTQMESPKRKMQKRNDYQRHKLFRKIKRRRKAQTEADQHIAEKQLRKKLKLPKFGGGKGIKSETGAPLEVKDGMLYYKETGEPFYSAGLLLPEVEIIGDKSKVNPWLLLVDITRLHIGILMALFMVLINQQKLQ